MTIVMVEILKPKKRIGPEETGAVQEIKDRTTGPTKSKNQIYVEPINLFPG